MLKLKQKRKKPERWEYKEFEDEKNKNNEVKEDNNKKDESYEEDEDDDGDQDNNDENKNKFNLNRDNYKISNITDQSLNFDSESQLNSKQSPYRYGHYNSPSTYTVNIDNQPKSSVEPSAPPLLTNLNETIPFFKTPNRTFTTSNEYLNEKTSSTVNVIKFSNLHSEKSLNKGPSVKILSFYRELFFSF